MPRQESGGDARAQGGGELAKAPPGQTAPDKALPADAAPADAGRDIIYTADLNVRAKNVDAGVTKAKQLVTAAGGHVANENSSTEPPSAHVVFRIPADKYATVLDQLTRQIGTRLGLEQQAEDVTGEVADVESRVKSAQSTLDSFRKLLNRANTIGEVLNVEQEISRREADLEALQARQKALAQQTRFATVTLDVLGPESAPKREHREGGFVGGLKAGWSAFTGLLSGLALVAGWLLPFTPILAPAVVLAIWLHRRRRRDRPGDATGKRFPALAPQQTPAQTPPQPSAQAAQQAPAQAPQPASEHAPPDGGDGS